MCLVHDPRPSSPVGKTFTVEYLGNVLGGPPVIYLNVDMSVIKDIAAKTLQGGEPVWFGCDVGQDDEQRLRGSGTPSLYDLSVGLRRLVRRWTRPTGSPTTRPR